MHCLNCNKPLIPGATFCPSCGQKTAIRRLTLHDLLHDTIHYFTHADKGIFHLLKELARKPGLVARAYVTGARKKYFNPINFLLIVAGIVVFMTAVFSNPGNMGSRRPQSTRTTVTRPPTAEEKKLYAEMGKRAANVNKFFTKYANLVTILATPLFALLFWLFYFRNQFNYTEHLIANMYFVGFIMLFYALLFVPLQSVLGQITLLIFFLFECIYRGLAYYQFIGRKGAWPMTKAMFISFLLAGIWIASTYLVISTYIRTGFRGIF
jgi:hypothetical protein